MEVDLSIVIVTWNAREVLIPAIESIYREVTGISFEVIVSENDSKDGSADAVEKAFPDARVLRNARNLGFAGGNNVGLKEVRGRYAVLLNSDTITHAGAFESMVAYMDAHPEVGACGPQLLNPDGSKQNCVHNFPSLVTEVLNVSLLRILFPEKYPSKRRNYTAPVEVDAVLGACLLLRREVLEKVGYMDAGYFFFLEETDWCSRIKEAGWKVMHFPGAKITHLFGESTKKKVPAETRIEYLRSLYRFFRKNRGRTQEAAVIAIRLVKLAINAFLFAALTVLSLGLSHRPRRKAAESARMLLWHVRGCPADWGLSGIRR